MQALGSQQRLLALGQQYNYMAIDTTVHGINLDATADDGKYSKWDNATKKFIMDTPPSGGAVALSDLLAATASNTINNVDFAQDWQWNSLAGGTALSLSSSSTLATSNTQNLLYLSLSGVNANASQSTYTASFENSHSGTGADNIALYLSAISGATNTALEIGNGNLKLTPQTASRIAILDANKNIISADTATYPSLTELSYLKGVTGAISTTYLPLVGATYTTTTGTGLALTSSTITSGTLASIVLTGTAALTGQKALVINVSGANGTGAQTTYGLYSTNTHTGTSVNVGGYFSASGGSSNYGLLVANGNVGIGNTAPTVALDVTGAITMSGIFTMSSSATNSLRFITTATSGGAVRLGAGNNDYRLTNGGSTIAAFCLISPTANSSTAGRMNYGFDWYGGNGFVMSAFNDGLTYRIARSAINTVDLVNTAGAERGDLVFYTQNAGAGLSEGFRQTYNQLIGIGTGATVSAKLHVISITEQFRVGYDINNYYSTTIGSTGGITFDAVGVGASFTFSDAVDVNASLTADSIRSIGSLQVASIVNDTGLASGTYTPTLTNTTNINSSTAFDNQYMRVGNVVTVSGKVTMDPTAAGAVVLEMTLPVASNFTAEEQCGGVAVCDAALDDSVAIAGDVTNNTANFHYTAIATGTQTYHFTFTYLIV